MRKKCWVDWRTVATLWADTVIILVTLIESHSCHRHLNVKSMKRHTKIHKQIYVCFNRKLLERKFCTATCGRYDKIFWQNKRSLVAEDRGSFKTVSNNCKIRPQILYWSPNTGDRLFYGARTGIYIPRNFFIRSGGDAIF